jgi:HPr kinase/phosphorylase
LQPSRQILYGTCVAFGDAAVLLRGPSGSGKSDLALRCMGLESAQAAELVADDQVAVEVLSGRLMASPPEPLGGKIELRGLGIVETAYRGNARLVLVCDLVAEQAVPRMPPEEPETVDILGIAIPLIRLAALHASTPLKLRLAVLAAAADFSSSMTGSDLRRIAQATKIAALRGRSE